jgi:signal peptidase I
MMSSVQGPDDVHNLKCELAAEVLRTCGRLRLQVTGWSMLPAVWPGDTLVVERIGPGAVGPGDIVLFTCERRLLVHRVVKTLDDSRLLTRGDAMSASDPVVDRHELLGRVSFIQREGRCIAPLRRRSFSERAIAGLVRNSKIAARVLVGVRGRHRV